MPTKIKDPSNPGSYVHIDWQTFVIEASDSETEKKNLMKESMAAMKNNKYVAVLGIKRDQGKKKTAVLLHRASGDKRVSVATDKSHANSRVWEDIKSGHDYVWVAFKEIVGKGRNTTIYDCKDSNSPFSCYKHLPSK
jgi:hypothetical protein